MPQTKSQFRKNVTVALLVCAALLIAVVSRLVVVSQADRTESGDALTSARYRGAILQTSFGDVEIAFNPKTPRAVNNFIRLAANQYFDQTRFHRVVNSVLIQAGDPLTRDANRVSEWGHGGPGYFFPDEIFPGDQMAQGTVAMANNGPDTNGSQFFILVNSAPWLDSRHTIFAQVTRGIETVLRIAATPAGITEIPTQEIRLKKVILLRHRRFGW